MNLTTRTLVAIAALIVIEGAIILIVLAAHGGLGWIDAAGVVAFVVATALVVGVALRWSSG